MGVSKGKAWTSFLDLHSEVECIGIGVDVSCIGTYINIKRQKRQRESMGSCLCVGVHGCSNTSYV